MPTQEQITEARDELSGFLTYVYNFLREMATRQRDRRDRRLFLEELQPLIENAWREFEEDFNLERAVMQVRELSEANLQSHGLYGNQLRLKTRVIGIWRDLFEATGGVALFKRLVSAIDTVLRSLTAAAGIDKAIEELKDILCDSLDEND